MGGRVLKECILRGTMESNMEKFNKAAASLDRTAKYNRPMSTLVQPKRLGMWLAVYAKTGNMSTASSASHIPRSYIKQLARKSPVFMRRLTACKEQAHDGLVSEAYRRGVEGVEEPVFGRQADGSTGKVGTIRKYSDRLLEKLLMASMPDKFANISGRVNDSHTRVGNLTINVTQKLEEARERLKAIDIEPEPVSDEESNDLQ